MNCTSLLWKGFRACLEGPLINNAIKPYGDVGARTNIALCDSSYYACFRTMYFIIFAVTGCHVYFSNQFYFFFSFLFRNKPLPVIMPFKQHKLATSSCTWNSVCDTNKYNQLLSVCDIITFTHCECLPIKQLCLQLQLFKQICSQFLYTPSTVRVRSNGEPGFLKHYSLIPTHTFKQQLTKTIHKFRAFLLLQLTIRHLKFSDSFSYVSCIVIRSMNQDFLAGAGVRLPHQRQLRAASC